MVQQAQSVPDTLAVAAAQAMGCPTSDESEIPAAQPTPQSQDGGEDRPPIAEQPPHNGLQSTGARRRMSRRQMAAVFRLGLAAATAGAGWHSATWGLLSEAGRTSNGFQWLPRASTSSKGSEMKSPAGSHGRSSSAAAVIVVAPLLAHNRSRACDMHRARTQARHRSHWGLHRRQSANRRANPARCAWLASASRLRDDELRGPAKWDGRGSPAHRSSVRIG